MLYSKQALFEEKKCKRQWAQNCSIIQLGCNLNIRTEYEVEFDGTCYNKHILNPKLLIQVPPIEADLNTSTKLLLVKPTNYLTCTRQIAVHLEDWNVWRCVWV